MAYNTRGNGKSEPRNDVNIPIKNLIKIKEKKQMTSNKPVNAPTPIIYLNTGKLA